MSKQSLLPVTRRSFLQAAFSSLVSSPAALQVLPGCSTRPARDERRPPLVDFHVHLFGTGDSRSGCFLSSEITDGFQFAFLKQMLGLSSRAATVDEAYVEALIDEVECSGLDRAVLLAQDGVYDPRGRLDKKSTHVYVPNDYLLEVTEALPHLLEPCISINPDRRDALDELELYLARGARILKIHPPIQGVDLEARKHRAFLARCAEGGVVLMVHTGHEHSAPVVDIRLADPRKLMPALEEGCTVVACHCGTGWAGEEPDFLPHFLTLARKYPERLWGDTSILGSPKRLQDVSRLLEEKEVLPQLLHGSDYPFPSIPLAFAGRIGVGQALRLQREPSVLRRDLELKVALGFGLESAKRAGQLALSSAAETKKTTEARPSAEPPAFAEGLQRSRPRRVNPGGYK